MKPRSSSIAMHLLAVQALALPAAAAQYLTKAEAAQKLVDGRAVQALVHDSSADHILAHSGKVNATFSSSIVDSGTSNDASIPAGWKLTPPARALRNASTSGTDVSATGVYINNDSTITLYAMFPFDPADDGAAAHILKSYISGTIPDAAEVDEHGSKGVKVHVAQAFVSDTLDKLANMHAVAAVEPRLQMQYHNAPEARILQSGKADTQGFDAAPFWKAGINGTGQLVQVGDTGLDVQHCLFRDPNQWAQYAGPHHRKVYDYVMDYVSADFKLGEHGSHVTGSIVGRNVSNDDAGESEDGVAFGARVHFTAFGKPIGASIPVPEHYAEYFKRAHDAGARVSSNSWGAMSSYKYSISTFYIDNYLQDHNDSVVLFSAGNDGALVDPLEVGSPIATAESFGSVDDQAVAKNALTVGASLSTGRPLFYRELPSWSDKELKVVPEGFELQLDDPNFGHAIPALDVGNVPLTSLSNPHHVMALNACSDIFNEASAKNSFVFVSLDGLKDCFQHVIQQGELIEDEAVYFVPGFTCGPAVKGGSINLLEIQGNITVASVSKQSWEVVAQLAHMKTSLTATLSLMKVDEDMLWESTVATFSSKGPTPDDRMKPDVVAPGVAIRSAKANTYCGIEYMQGTSMATPLTAGATILVREYMQKRKLSYPSGTLLKATLINGAQQMTGYTISLSPYAFVLNDSYIQRGDGLLVDEYEMLRSMNINGTVVKPYPLDATPGCSQGFGRVDLSKSVPIETDSNSPSKLIVYDNVSLSEGDKFKRNIRVTGNEELRITLAWYDEAPSVMSPPFLINDLDLEVHGETWKRPLVRRDAKNKVERVVVPHPASEDVEIIVKGIYVPSDEQSFALVATGNIEEVDKQNEKTKSKKSSDSMGTSNFSDTSKGLLAAFVVTFVVLLAIIGTGIVIFIRNRRKTYDQVEPVLIGI